MLNPQDSKTSTVIPALPAIVFVVIKTPVTLILQDFSVWLCTLVYFDSIVKVPLEFK